MLMMLICSVKAYILRKNTQALAIASKETGLKVNAEKTKYMVMSRDQNAGQNGYIQIGNKSFETVEQFKYLRTTLTNQNSIHEEIKNRLVSLGAESFCLPVCCPENIKIYRIIILSISMGVKHGLSHRQKNISRGCLRIGC